MLLFMTKHRWYMRVHIQGVNEVTFEQEQVAQATATLASTLITLDNTSQNLITALNWSDPVSHDQIDSALELLDTTREVDQPFLEAFNNESDAYLHILTWHSSYTVNITVNIADTTVLTGQFHVTTPSSTSTPDQLLDCSATLYHYQSHQALAITFAAFDSSRYTYTEQQ